jgi:hypothetical protein
VCGLRSGQHAGNAIEKEIDEANQKRNICQKQKKRAVREVIVGGEAERDSAEKHHRNSYQRMIL